MVLSVFLITFAINLHLWQYWVDDLNSQEIIRKIASSSGKFEPGQTKAFFNNKLVVPPIQELALEPEGGVLAAVSPEEKWVEIDLTNQVLRAHEADRVVYEFPVSTGKFGATPTGNFRIWIKLRYTKMSGGSQALGTYYYLPNVPYTMYFHNGFGIHGTYWHNNFGHPMSHGCVNMRTPDAEMIFNWSDPQIASTQHTFRPTKDNPGTRVVVHGTTPRE